jgi:hypothetical protein
MMTKTRGYEAGGQLRRQARPEVQAQTHVVCFQPVPFAVVIGSNARERCRGQGASSVLDFAGFIASAAKRNNSWREEKKN